MSRRVSQRWRNQCSDVIEPPTVTARDVDCSVTIRGGKGPRRLIYRRLRGLEYMFHSEWPKSTNIFCWYCRFPFDGIPIPIVQQYDSVKDQYDVYGICCSGPCSKAYIRSLKTNDARTRLVWQEHMLVEEFGWPHNVPIPSAPPWQTIKEYGGDKTIEEFRGTPMNLSIKLKMPPFVPHHIYTETELKGVALIEETPSNVKETDDSVEEQAMQHGASFSLKKLRRPPESEIIRTEEQLYEKYPDCVVEGEEEEPFFRTFLRTHNLPSDEECINIRKRNKEKRKADALRAKQAKSQRLKEKLAALAIPSEESPETPVPNTSSPSKTSKGKRTNKDPPFQNPDSAEASIKTSMESSIKTSMDTSVHGTRKRKSKPKDAVANPKVAKTNHALLGLEPPSSTLTCDEN